MEGVERNKVKILAGIYLVFIIVKYKFIEINSYIS